MLEKQQQHIFEMLEHDQDYQELENWICDLLPSRLDQRGIDDLNIQKFNELQLKIIEQAYLKGYNDAFQLYNEMREEPEKYLRLDQLIKINADIERPATKKAAGLK